MRTTAVYALRQALKEGFVILLQRELEALDALPGWMTRLYTALLRCTDYGTGKGETSYANLQALLTPIQPRSGPRHDVPTLQAIKRAVELLEDRKLLTRDKLHSQHQQRLIFLTMPRYEKARPQRKLDPQTRPPSNRPDAPIHAGSKASPGGTRPPNSTPSSTAFLSHIKEGELSTESRVIPGPPQADTPPGPIVAAAGQKLGPPREAEHCPPDGGHAPRPTRYARQVLASQRGRKIDPPGGEVDAPQGVNTAAPLSARLRRPTNSVLRGDAGVLSDGNPAAGQGGEVQDGP